MNQSDDDELSDSSEKIQSSNSLNTERNQHRSANRDLVKFLHRNTMSSPYTQTVPSNNEGLKSPETPIIMNSLSHIKNINQSSPFQTAAFTGNSNNHSTPTPQAKPMTDDTLELDDFVHVNSIDAADNIQSNSRPLHMNHEGLTLDLNPDPY